METMTQEQFDQATAERANALSVALNGADLVTAFAATQMMLANIIQQTIQNTPEVAATMAMDTMRLAQSLSQEASNVVVTLEKSVYDFMQAAGQQVGTEKPDYRQTALYLGLIVEEVGETLAAVIPDHYLVKQLPELAHELKTGEYDNHVIDADPVKMLDGTIDTAFVSLGASFSMGAHVPTAIAEVHASNMSKTNPETGMFERDENGKVKKPATHYRADFGKALGWMRYDEA